MSTPGLHYPHRIRLRGPWQCELLDEQPSRTRRLRMPCRLGEAGLAGYHGRVLLRRPFHYPGRIDEEERVWLTFAGIEGAAEVSVNDEVLGTYPGSGPLPAFEITPLLRQRNEIVVAMTAVTEDVGLWGEVALEVRRTASLYDVQAKMMTDASVLVTGKVIGEAPRPLDVYVVSPCGTAGYGTVSPRADGCPFEIALDAAVPVEVGQTLRVELVDGGSIWYVCEVRVEKEAPS